MLKTFQVYWDKEKGVLRLHEVDADTGQVLKDITGVEAFDIFSQWKEESNFPPAISFPVISHNSGLKEGDDDLLQAPGY